MFTRLYLHIPFCLSKCPYCAFTSVDTDAFRAEYPHLLAAEREIAATECAPSSPLESVYFGGGTPSLLPPEAVGRLLEDIARHWGLADGAEITIEANPGTVDRVRMEHFRAAGINRISLGVQSFDDRQLAMLGRAHDAHQALQAFEAARAAGFDNIGIDLIHSLPGQTLTQWISHLRQAVSLAPDHISSYGLTIEEGTPFAERYPEDSPRLPDGELSADMYEAAADHLTAAGYRHYEIANFALPGRQSRHNSGYWRREGYLGLGAGAHSFLREPPHGIRFCTTPDLEDYARAVTGGRLPRQELTRLSDHDAMAEFMFLGLRMADGISIAAFRDEFGVSPDEAFGSAPAELEQYGLVQREDDTLRLSRRGMLLSNRVFGRFIA